MTSDFPVPKSEPLTERKAHFTRPEAAPLPADHQRRCEQLRHDNAPRAELRTAACAGFGAEGALVPAQSEARVDIEARLQGHIATPEAANAVFAPESDHIRGRSRREARRMTVVCR
ncbi:MAG: hypothetical protein MUQ30_14505 [Anaerolineae bacterium]|nr:hypothetical protein [Anaerolineae bacterium]